MKHLAIRAVFKDCVYTGRRLDNKGSEFPPSPYRLYQTLLSSAHYAGNQLLWDKNAKHFEELFVFFETLRCSTIFTPKFRKGAEFVWYVPKNEGDTYHTQTKKITDGDWLFGTPAARTEKLVANIVVEDKVKEVLAAFYKGDALPLAKFAPTSLIFGAWDSRGNAAIKIRRIITSMIKAEDVSINYESAQFDSAAADLYQDEEGEIPAEESQEKTKLSTFGLADAPSCWQRSGVYVNGDIYQFASLNLNLIRTYRTAKPDETHALQRYILGLALAAFFRPQTFDLRAGCTLTRDGEDATQIRLCDVYGKEETVHIDYDHIVAFAKAAAKDFGVGQDLEADFLKAKADRVVSSVRKKK